MNEFQQYGYGQPEIAPQAFLGGAFGAPAGGFIGRNIGDIFGNPNLGSRIGEFAGGILGSLSPFSADPSGAQFGAQPQQLQQLQQLRQLQQLQQLQQQQQQQLQQQQQQAQMEQFSPQGWGSWVKKLAKPAGNLIGQVTHSPTLGGIIGGGLQQIGGFLPQSVDAQGGAVQQQQQQHPLVQQLQQIQAQQHQLHQALQQLQQQAVMLQRQLAAQAQAQVGGQGGIAPQSWLTDLAGLAGQYAQPIGSFIGSQFGNQQLGSTIGGIAGQLTGLFPQSADPYAAYAQQAQQAQLAQMAQLGGQQTMH